MGAEQQPVEKVRQSLERYIRSRGLKATRQRDLIVEALARAKGHLTVEQIVTDVRRQDARVSQATVYRTMRLLVECGLASARQFGDGQTLYEIAGERNHHDHLICTRCKTIIEFENDRIEHLQDSVAKRHGFLVTHHKMELYGLCKQCREEERNG